MGTRTQQQPMMVPPPEARAIPTDQSWLSETDPVSRTVPGNPNKNEEWSTRQSGGWRDTDARQLILDLKSDDEARRSSAMRQLQREDSFNALSAALRTGKLSDKEFHGLFMDLIRNRDPQVQQ